MLITAASPLTANPAREARSLFSSRGTMEASIAARKKTDQHRRSHLKVHQNRPTRILIIEDDQSMAIALKLGFEHEGFDVQMARDGAGGLRYALKAKADMLILDVMLPKMSGLDVCKQMRASGDQTPIIMLTARGQELDKVVGLKVGADDYVTKPFGFQE